MALYEAVAAKSTMKLIVEEYKSDLKAYSADDMQKYIDDDGDGVHVLSFDLDTERWCELLRLVEGSEAKDVQDIFDDGDCLNILEGDNDMIWLADSQVGFYVHKEGKVL